MNNQIKQIHAFSLPLAVKDEHVIVVSVNANRHINSCLLMMGMIEGTELHILAHQNNGNILVACQNQQWSLTEKMAYHIVVKHKSPTLS